MLCMAYLLYVCWLCCALFLHQGRNGNHERIDFLTSKEKVQSKRKAGILIGVLVALLILAAVAAFLIWLFVCGYSWKLSSAFRVETWSMLFLYVWVCYRWRKSWDVGHCLDKFVHRSRLFLIVFTFPTSVTANIGITSESVKWVISTSG